MKNGYTFIEVVLFITFLAILSLATREIFQRYIGPEIWQSMQDSAPADSKTVPDQPAKF
jgi:Tfp pilus assembly protein PilE